MNGEIEVKIYEILQRIRDELRSLEELRLMLEAKAYRDSEVEND